MCPSPLGFAAPHRSPVFTLVPDRTKNACKYSFKSQVDVNVTSHSNVVDSVFARLRDVWTSLLTSDSAKNVYKRAGIGIAFQKVESVQLSVFQVQMQL